MSTNARRRFGDGVSASTLRTLAAALQSGRLAPPLNEFSLSKIAPCPASFLSELQQLLAEGLALAHLSLLLESAAVAAEARLVDSSSAELVWTGPESAVAHSRDTAVVVEELFSMAQKSVLVSTFVIQQGRKVFGALSARRDAVPDLVVRLFVHVNRPWRDTREDSEILREHAEVRASWHAKCVLVDDEVSFVTSANFTEWAQQRNVEAGVLVRSPHFTRQFRAQFDGLVRAKLVRRLPGF